MAHKSRVTYGPRKARTTRAKKKVKVSRVRYLKNTPRSIRKTYSRNKMHGKRGIAAITG